jgi:predicted metal-dependent hydrolase
VIEKSQIQFGMTPIPYVIRRTGRQKTVALTIEGRGKLVVTAPDGVSIDKLIIQAHIPLIEYVLVHELAHLGNRSHDREFWDAVEQWLPDYEQRRARLREIGPSLVW